VRVGPIRGTPDQGQGQLPSSRKRAYPQQECRAVGRTAGRVRGEYNGAREVALLWGEGLCNPKSVFFLGLPVPVVVSNKKSVDEPVVGRRAAFVFEPVF